MKCTLRPASSEEKLSETVQDSPTIQTIELGDVRYKEIDSVGLDSNRRKRIAVESRYQRVPITIIAV